MHLDRRLVYYYFILFHFFFFSFSFIWQVTIQIKSRAVMSAIRRNSKLIAHAADFWTPCSFSVFFLPFPFFFVPLAVHVFERTFKHKSDRETSPIEWSKSHWERRLSQWETVFSQYSISIFIATFLSRVYMIIQHYMSSIHLCMYIYWEKTWCVCVEERAHGDVWKVYIYLITLLENRLITYYE